jgi:hypothetical protein
VKEFAQNTNEATKPVEKVKAFPEEYSVSGWFKWKSKYYIRNYNNN